MMLCIWHNSAEMVSADANVFTQDGVIHGHHVYKQVWTPFIIEELTLQQESHNSHDRFAVTVMKEGSVVGRVPRELSRAYWMFIEQGGLLSVGNNREQRAWKGTGGAMCIQILWI